MFKLDPISNIGSELPSILCWQSATHAGQRPHASKSIEPKVLVCDSAFLLEFGIKILDVSRFDCGVWNFCKKIS
jgi:hypothetical protein